MEEPKPPCKTCGPTGWKPQPTRREFFQNAAIAGIGLTAAATMLTAPTAAKADTFDIDECLTHADAAYEDCLENANQVPGTGIWAKAERLTLKGLCITRYKLDKEACYEALDLELVKEVAEFTVRYLNTPEGHIVLIEGFLFLVLAGGLLVLA